MNAEPDLPFWSCVAVIAVCFAIVVAHCDGLAIRTSAAFIFDGGSLRVTCSVPRAPENREIEWGIADYTSRARDLEGENAPITFEQLFTKIPCGSTTAYCRVKNRAGEFRAVVQSFNVIGCDGDN